MKNHYLLSLLFFVCLTATSQEIDYQKFGMDLVDAEAPWGLDEGTTAPLFSGKDQNGKKVKLRKLLKKGPVVLLFYRGEWCPVCNRYLSRFADSLSMITERNAAVVAVTPEAPEYARGMMEKTSAGLVVVSDKSGAIMDAYDVKYKVTEKYADMISTRLQADIAGNNQQEEPYLPVPATYIIDRSGTIVFRQFDINYRNRASIKDILANLP